MPSYYIHHLMSFKFVQALQGMIKIKLLYIDQLVSGESDTGGAGTGSQTPWGRPGSKTGLMHVCRNVVGRFPQPLCVLRF